MGERLLCKQEVIGSIPFTSTRLQEPGVGGQASRKLGKRTIFVAWGSRELWPRAVD